jgi:hypothetical protein
MKPARQGKEKQIDHMDLAKNFLLGETRALNYASDPSTNH